jgi:hypothetical protein
MLLCEEMVDCVMPCSTCPRAFREKSKDLEIERRQRWERKKK